MNFDACFRGNQKPEMPDCTSRKSANLLSAMMINTDPPKKVVFKLRHEVLNRHELIIPRTPQGRDVDII